MPHSSSNSVYCCHPPFKVCNSPAPDKPDNVPRVSATSVNRKLEKERFKYLVDSLRGRRTPQ